MVSAGLFAGFDVPDVPERLVEITSGDAWVLIGVRPAGPDEPGLTCRKLYRKDSATMAERLARLERGRRICSC